MVNEPLQLRKEGASLLGSVRTSIIAALYFNDTPGLVCVRRLIDGAILIVSAWIYLL